MPDVQDSENYVQIFLPLLNINIYKTVYEITNRVSRENKAIRLSKQRV